MGQAITPIWQLLRYKNEGEYNERFNKRVNWITTAFEELKSTEIFKPYHTHFRLDKYLTQEVVNRYFKEVARIKQFHSIKNTSPEKTAAYLTIWIARIKPIQITSDIIDESHNWELRYVNEHLAIYLSLAILKGSIDERLGAKLDCFALSKKDFENLLYHFRYRVMHADNLCMTFEALISGLSIGLPEFREEYFSPTAERKPLEGPKSD